MRRGPRFTGESTEETMRRMQAAAVRLMKERGLSGFSFRALASAPELAVAATAPLYYFGTTAGVLAAIAERGFDDLRSELARARTTTRSPSQLLVRVALAHAHYGLERPRLYQGIHAARLWEAVGRSVAGSKALEKAQPWLERATAARNSALHEYVEAVQVSQRAGVIRRMPPDPIAHLLTTVVDGFLFQAIEEQVGSQLRIDERLNNLSEMISLALRGVRVRPNRRA